MDWETSFETYLEHLCEALGHLLKKFAAYFAKESR